MEIIECTETFVEGENYFKVGDRWFWNCLPVDKSLYSKLEEYMKNNTQDCTMSPECPCEDCQAEAEAAERGLIDRF